MAVRDRVAFACMFLNDNQVKTTLYSFLTLFAHYTFQYVLPRDISLSLDVFTCLGGGKD